MHSQYESVRKKIDKAARILVVSHRKPDADTLGAALALKFWLAKVGKSVTLACIDPVPRNLLFLPGSDSFVDGFDLSHYDLVIIVDSGASYMTNFHLKYENFFKIGIPLINIDHHSSNDYFGNINIVEPDEASTTAILFKMFKEWGIMIDADMATCLLAGVYNDTGSFMHSNTSSQVMKIASDLVSCGARLGEITKEMFNTTAISTLRLWGKVLEKADITDDKVVMSIIKSEDYDFAEADPEELSGVVDFLNMVPSSRFAILVNEDGKGNVKGSFRTRRSDIDVSRIAAVFGGGGHPKASGFFMPGKLEEVVSYKIVSDDRPHKSLKF